MTLFSEQTEADFQRAHQRAFFKKALALFKGKPNEDTLLSFDDVKQKLGWRDESYIGLRQVPVDAIVGSVGRYKDFDREFLPLHRGTKKRWQSIDQAYYDSIELPPVQLYKVGDVYFVKDGNHRVSVAREQGVQFIDAEVIECRPRVALKPNLTAEDLEGIGEYAAFLDWSKLDELRPDQDIRFTIPGGYNQLREHINVHRYYLGLQRGREVPLAEAVTSWYDNLYLPLVHLIREDNILQRFPHRTEADLYLWIMDHLYFLRQRYGDVDAEEAVQDFADRFAHPSLVEAIRRRIASLLPSGKEDERRE